MKQKTNVARLTGMVFMSLCLSVVPYMVASGAGVPGPSKTCTDGSTQPVAYIYATGDRTVLGDSTTIAFDATFSRDCGSQISSYSWNFGDGTIENGPESVLNHTYGVGAWQPTLTVTNVNGQSDSYTLPETFTVRPNNTSPVAHDATLDKVLSRTSTDCLDFGQYVSDVENDMVYVKNVQIVSLSHEEYNNAHISRCGLGSNGYSLVVNDSHVVHNLTAVLSYEAVDVYDGASNTAYITLNLTATNQAPVASDGQLTVTEDQGSQFVYMTQVADFDDADNDSLAMTIVDDPDYGTLTHEEGTVYRYQPNTNFSGTDSFVYEVSDGAKTARGTITINVAPVNDTPYFNASAVPAFATNEDTSLSGSIAAAVADVDGDVLSFSSTTQGVTMNSDGSFTYVPAANVSGVETITFSVSDGKGGEIVRSFSITVNAVNDAPSATLSAQVQGRNVVVFNAVATDPEGDSLTYTWDFGDSSTAVTTTGATSHQYSVKGKAQTSFVAKVTISDGKGGVTTKMVAVKL